MQEDLRPSLALWIAVIAILVFLLAPIAITIPMAFSSSRTLTFPPPGLSFRHFEALLGAGGSGSTTWRSAIWNSLSVGVASAAVALALALPAALGLRRLGRRARMGLTAYFVLPMVTPLIVSSISFYLFFIWFDMVGSFAGLTLAHAAIAAPFVLLILAAAMDGLERDLEHAAESLGATAPAVLRTVTLPLIAPALVSSFMLAFVTSLDEIIVALFLGGNRYRTLPVKMFEGIRFEFDPTVTAAGLMMMTLAFGALLLALFFRHRSRGGSTALAGW